MYQIVKSALLPPMPYLAAALIGLLLARRRGDGGWWLAFAAIALLLLLSTPLAAGFLLEPLQRHQPPAAQALAAAQAIVVLGGDEGIPPDIGPLTLVRLRHGARLQNATGLPLLVSGWPMAAAMKSALENDFHVPVTWCEEDSLDTRENAAFSARILKQHGIARVLLVTHAWHMARARAAFARAGIDAFPAPTGFVARAAGGPWLLMPSAGALEASHFAVYEMLGNLWYDLEAR